MFDDGRGWCWSRKLRILVTRDPEYEQPVLYPRLSVCAAGEDPWIVWRGNEKCKQSVHSFVTPITLRQSCYSSWYLNVVVQSTLFPLESFIQFNPLRQPNPIFIHTAQNLCSTPLTLPSRITFPLTFSSRIPPSSFNHRCNKSLLSLGLICWEAVPTVT